MEIPIGALIDRHEQWCIMYGAGIIVYFLRPPFQEYSYHQSTPQWVEYHRYRDDLWFIDNAQQLNSNQVIFTADPNSNVAGLYMLDIQHLKINPLEKIKNAGL